MWQRILGKVQLLFRGFFETGEEYSRRRNFERAVLYTFCALLIAGSLLGGMLHFVYIVCQDLGIHFIGVFMMLAAAILAGFSAAIAKKIHHRRGKRRREITRKIRIISIVICASGLLLAILLG